MTDPTQKMIDALARCEKVLITTHVRPDGDALGSTAALSLGLRARGIASEIMLLSQLPPKYAFVHEDAGVVCFDVENGWPAGFDINHFDALAIVDTGTWSQLPGLKEHVAKFDKPTLVIDHHQTQEDWATHKLVNPQAAAACEVVADLLKRWDITIDRAMAGALFVGLATDTGWFQYSNTTPATMRLGAEVMSVGVDTDRIYQALYQNERSERLAIQTRALQSLELLAGGKLALMRLAQADFAQTGATANDTEGLINIPLQVRDVEVSILLTDPPAGGAIRVSLRSKGRLNVAAFAQQFGGGGHARAAGLKVDAPLEAATQRVRAAALESLSAL